MYLLAALGRLGPARLGMREATVHCRHGRLAAARCIMLTFGATVTVVGIGIAAGYELRGRIAQWLAATDGALDRLDISIEIDRLPLAAQMRQINN